MVECCKKEWKEVKKVENKVALSESEYEYPSTQTHTFALPLSSDYQTSKLIAFWEVLAPHTICINHTANYSTII